jgi:hypothetical protein
MKSKHRRTLERIFERPTPSDIRWNDIESMLRAVGVGISERAGSRVLLKMGPERIVIHRPHPSTQTGRATVRSLAMFLRAIGVTP